MSDKGSVVESQGWWMAGKCWQAPYVLVLWWAQGSLWTKTEHDNADHNALITDCQGIRAQHFQYLFNKSTTTSRNVLDPLLRRLGCATSYSQITNTIASMQDGKWHHFLKHRAWAVRLCLNDCTIFFFLVKFGMQVSLHNISKIDTSSRDGRKETSQRSISPLAFPSQCLSQILPSLLSFHLTKRQVLDGRVALGKPQNILHAFSVSANKGEVFKC